jgi:hypothetical protein
MRFFWLRNGADAKRFAQHVGIQGADCFEQLGLGDSASNAWIRTDWCSATHLKSPWKIVKVSWDHHSFQLEDITLEKYMKHYETINQMSVSKGHTAKIPVLFNVLFPERWRSKHGTTWGWDSPRSSAASGARVRTFGTETSWASESQNFAKLSSADPLGKVLITRGSSFHVYRYIYNYK